MFTRPEATGLNLNINYTTESGSQVTVAATADVKTDFMQMMGFPKLKVGADSQARWGNTKLRVGLVLDNTGSMASDGKMDALKTATKALLTQLKNSAAQNGDVYVSIIPFSKDVNIGKQFTLDSSLLRLDLAAAAYGLGGLTNLQLWNIPILGILNSTWNGCVADRDKNYDTTNTVPSSSLLASLFPIEQYDNCPVELMPLSHDWNKLNAKVDSMKPVGMTNQTIGLQWGFQSLTAAPFTIRAKNSNYKYSEVHHYADRRVEHREPVRRQHGHDGCTDSVDLLQHQVCRNHTLYRAGEHDRRSDTGLLENVRQLARQVCRAQERKSDGGDIQRDRNFALQPAHRAINSVCSQTRTPAARPGFFAAPSQPDHLG